MNKDLHWEAILNKVIKDVYASGYRHYHTNNHIDMMLGTFRY